MKAPSVPRLQFFAYSWKLPAYNRASLLSAVLGSLFASYWSFLVTVGALLLTLTVVNEAFLLTMGKRL